MYRFALFSILSLSIFQIIGLADQNSAAPTAISHGPSRAVDPTARYHRFICLVYLTGSGKKDDPQHPEYTPAAIDPGRTGIIAWSMQVTDDGKMAIVHYVAVDRKAFAPILADKRAEIRVFETGVDRPEKIEAELKKFKKDFTLDSLKVVAQ